MSSSGNGVKEVFDTTLGAPPLVHQCITYLERHLEVNNNNYKHAVIAWNMITNVKQNKVEGLFRVAGDELLLNQAKDHMRAGGQLVFVDEAEEEKESSTSSALRVSDPHTVAQLLKAFFREMPEALFESR